KAMKLVAAARLRRAQDAMTAARPYAKRLDEVVADLAGRLAAAARSEDPGHPMLARREVKTLRMVVVGSDRGLAGGYNSNLNRATERFMVDRKEQYPRIELSTVGRKAREHFRRRQVAVVKEYAKIAGDTALE